MSYTGIDFDDEIEAFKLLSSLHDSLNGIVTALSYSAGKTMLRPKEVKDLMVSEETCRKARSPSYRVPFKVGSKSASK